MSEISKAVRKYLTNNQSIYDCVRRGVINYSAIAREICSLYSIKEFDAVLMACRRAAKRIPHKQSNDQAILQLVKNAKVSLETKMTVVIIEKPKSFERLFKLHSDMKEEKASLYILEGEEVVTLILSENWIPEVKSAYKGKILRVRENLVQVTMSFSKKIETTPGVIAYVYRIFAEHGINILEEVSCYTDITLMIEESDLGSISEALRASHGGFASS